MYQDIKFETEVEFDRWLKETTAYVVDFLDKGQDLLRIWVAKNNEIINCNLQSSIWNGFVIDKAKLQLGELIHLNNPNLERSEPYDFKVCNIEQRVLGAV